jgi:hypothetical protein
MLVHGDGLKGVHNPTFVYRILTTSMGRSF